MSEIAIHRLFSQQLEKPVFKQPGELVSWMGAIQGQDYPGAKWSLGLRLPGSTDASIEQALVEKTIVRSWVFRGTLQIVSAEDLHWMLRLVGQQIITRNARRYRELELDEYSLARSNDVLSKALEDGKELNRKQLFAILEQNGISPEGQRGVHMLQRASLDRLICQGVSIRNNPTFYSIEKWLPEIRTIERDQALAELARRYFTSRGPATLQDFVWWSGLPVAEARAGLEAVKAQFIEETVDGQAYWRSDSNRIEPIGSPKVYLLPGYDEYLLAYRDRSASLDEGYGKDSIARNGMFSPTIVIDGQVAGIWKRSFEKGSVVIAADPIAPFSTAEDHAFTAAARRFGEFLGLAVVLAPTE